MIIITYERKLNLAFLVTKVFLQYELVSDEYPTGSESESESPSVMATSQVLESESDSARRPQSEYSETLAVVRCCNRCWSCPESESESVRSPESELK